MNKPRLHPRPTLLALLALSCATLPVVGTVGMFFDGAIYASISRNLSEGIGTVWNPQFSQTLFPEFREHPPLMFFLQSQFFNLLGDTLLTERIYDLTALALSLILVWKTWEILLVQEKRKDLAPYFWLVMLGFLTITKWLWAYKNNVLENTLTVFCLASTLAILHAAFSQSTKSVILFSTASAVFLFCAFLTKGLTSLFILPLPLFVCLVYRCSPNRLFRIYLTIIFSVTSLIAILVFISPDSINYMNHYLDRQLFSRVDPADLQWTILGELVKSLLPMGMISFATFFVLRTRLHRVKSYPLRPMILLTLIALSASVPLTLGDMASGHYLLPSFPYFVLLFGIVMASVTSASDKAIAGTFSAKPGPVFTGFLIASLLALLLWTITQYGKVRRDHMHHQFLTAVCATVSPCARRIISASDEVWTDWNIHAIAQRHFNLSIAKEGIHQYNIQAKSSTIKGDEVLDLDDSIPWVLMRSKAEPTCSRLNSSR